jgi:hypothetical protein
MEEPLMVTLLCGPDKMPYRAPAQLLFDNFSTFKDMLRGEADNMLPQDLGERAIIPIPQYTHDEVEWIVRCALNGNKVVLPMPKRYVPIGDGALEELEGHEATLRRLFDLANYTGKTGC